MIYVIYEFKCTPENQESFIRLWREATQVIRNNHGSLGSRLHHAGDSTYIAYAAWPDEETFTHAQQAPCKEVEDAIKNMRATLIESKRLHVMRPIEDMLEL
jgi:heme-degrading monooxygenase HmoA